MAVRLLFLLFVVILVASPTFPAERSTCHSTTPQPGQIDVSVSELAILAFSSGRWSFWDAGQGCDRGVANWRERRETARDARAKAPGGGAGAGGNVHGGVKELSAALPSTRTTGGRGSPRTAQAELHIPRAVKALTG